MLVPQKRKDLRPLKALVKGCAAESALLSKNVKKASKDEKQSFHLEKIKLGKVSRHYNLAYGFARGFSYKQLEQKTANKEVFLVGFIPGEGIDIEIIYSILKAHIPFLVLYVKQEDIKLWVTEGKQIYLTPQENAAKEDERYKKTQVGR